MFSKLASTSSEIENNGIAECPIGIDLRPSLTVVVTYLNGIQVTEILRGVQNLSLPNSAIEASNWVLAEDIIQDLMKQVGKHSSCRFNLEDIRALKQMPLKFPSMLIKQLRGRIVSTDKKVWPYM